MQQKINTWQFIYQSLQQNIEVMLLYVLESKGSSPGRQGFFMAVNADGKMSGSLGGGIMEHKFVELAKSKLKEPETEISLHQQIHDKSSNKNQSGMICSGEQTIFLYTVKKADAVLIEEIISSLIKNENGTVSLSPKGIEFSTAIPDKNFEFKLESENDFLFVEKTGFKNYLYIIGGGHCALAFSQLMSRMDFFITLIDTRDELNTIKQNDFVHQKIIVDDYNEIANQINPGKNCYVVIMTVGYRTDTIALQALLGKDFAYVGMLGSSSKIKKLIEEFKANITDAVWLNAVHAPIGLQIKSQSVDEIAVSIAAEIIQIKNAAF